MANVLGSLAPGFLIAAPPLGDPNFDRTVVLLAMHGDEGALGFVVNRRAPMTLGELLVLAGYGDAGIADDTPVYFGGPVQPSSGWIVCLDPTLAGDESGVIAVGERVRVTSSRAAFDALVHDVLHPVGRPGAPEDGGRRAGPAHPDPKHRMVMLGYSGWGAGQLEGEIAAGAWLPVPLDEGVLFDVPLGDKWEQAYALLGLTPAGMMSSHNVGEA
jgi:putative transcriptional regulator